MRILIVEDSHTTLTVLTGVMRRLTDVNVTGMDDPEAAMRAAAEEAFDLVLVDYVMPGMNGVEFIAALRATPGYAAVPVVMITADLDRKVKIDAIDAGATDFLHKPIDPVELKARTRNLLALRKSQKEADRRAEWLGEAVDAATRHLADREEEIIWRLARAIEYRDGGTGDHISRVATVSRLIAEGLGLEKDFNRTVYLAAPLHDVGKIGVPDAILSKPGRLTETEMAAMREHVTIGERILADGTSDLIRVAANIAATHHERWDGCGYPNRLRGAQIPIEGRIAAVADVFDALCSPRPYKAAWSLEAAYAEISANAGTHFDPACVAAFQLKWPEIREAISRAFQIAA